MSPINPTPSPSLLNNEITGNEHNASFALLPPRAGSNTTSKSLSRVSYDKLPASTVFK